MVATLFEKMIVRYSGYFKEIVFCYPERSISQLEIFKKKFGTKDQKQAFLFSKDKTITVNNIGKKKKKKKFFFYRMFRRIFLINVTAATKIEKES